jgi:hypothetical protein
MSRVVLNNQGIRRLFSNPQGPVARIVNARADRILSNAERNINMNMDSRTGDLLGSLRKIPIAAEVYHVVVGADAQHRRFPYALALETGKNPLTGEDMKFNYDYAYMVPAVRQSGFRQRS